MPLLSVKNFFGLNLELIGENLKDDVSSIKELGLTPNEVTVDFQKSMQTCSDPLVVVQIEYLFHKPESRPRSICQILTDRICVEMTEAVLEYSLPYNSVEVFLSTFGTLEQESYNAFSSWCKTMPAEVERAYSDINDYVDQFISGLITDFPLDLRVRSMLLAAYNLNKNSLQNLNPDNLGPDFILSADRIKRGFKIDDVILNLINHSKVLPPII